jgi:predicted acetyltransferase
MKDRLVKENVNMNALRLVTPTVDLKDEYLEMLDQWQKSGEKFVPWVLNFDPSDFHSMVQNFENFSKGIGIEDGFVKHSTYWLVNRQNRVLGAVIFGIDSMHRYQTLAEISVMGLGRTIEEKAMRLKCCG